MSACEIVVATTGVPGLIKPEMVHKGQIILAISNPNPEIEAELALKHGAAFAADGKSVNNVLGFPGIFRGAVDTWAPRITQEIAGRSCHGDCRLYNRRPAGPQSAGQEAASGSRACRGLESDRTGSGALGICPLPERLINSIRHKHMEVTQLSGFHVFFMDNAYGLLSWFLHQFLQHLSHAGNSLPDSFALIYSQYAIFHNT